MTDWADDQKPAYLIQPFREFGASRIEGEFIDGKRGG